MVPQPERRRHGRARRLLRPGGEADRAAHGGRDRARPGDPGLPISGIGGIATWRDAAEFIALGASNVQVCTAVMHYGFRIVEDMIDGLIELDGREGLSQHRPTSRPRRCRNVVDWEYLNLQLRRQGASSTRTCASSAAAATSPARTPRTRRSQATKNGQRHFEVIDDECVGCNLCVHVCPVPNCITLRRCRPASIDPRTGQAVPRLRPTGPRTRTTRCGRRNLPEVQRRQHAHRGDPHHVQLADPRRHRRQRRPRVPRRRAVSTAARSSRSATKLDAPAGAQVDRRRRAST